MFISQTYLSKFSSYVAICVRIVLFQESEDQVKEASKVFHPLLSPSSKGGSSGFVSWMSMKPFSSISMSSGVMSGRLWRGGVRCSRLHRGFILPFRNAVIIFRERQISQTIVRSTDRSTWAWHVRLINLLVDRHVTATSHWGFSTGKIPGWELDRLIGQTESKVYIFGLNSNEDRLGSHCVCPWV